MWFFFWNKNEIDYRTTEIVRVREIKRKRIKDSNNFGFGHFQVTVNILAITAVHLFELCHPNVYQITHTHSCSNKNGISLLVFHYYSHSELIYSSLWNIWILPVVLLLVFVLIFDAIKRMQAREQTTRLAWVLVGKKTCVKLVVGANFRQMCHENLYRILYKANARARFDQNLVRIVWQLSSLNLPWNIREKQIERVFNMSRFMHLFCLICGIYWKCDETSTIN